MPYYNKDSKGDPNDDNHPGGAIGKAIGRGCYGTCHEARLCSCSLASPVVLKFARLDGPVTSQNVIVDEARTAKDLSRPKLVEILGIVHEGSRVASGKYAAGKPFFDQLLNPKPYKP